MPCNGFWENFQDHLRLLRSLGAQVTVAARKQADLAWAQVEGMHGVFYEELPAYAGGFDYVVNTVPALYWAARFWRSCRRIACLLKLRPRRGGIDLEAAQARGLKVIKASSAG